MPSDKKVPLYNKKGSRPDQHFRPHSIFASLAYKDFTYLWLGQITHGTGIWLEMVARPMLILALTGSPIHLGLVMAIRTIPAIGFGMVAGVFADMFNRRSVLLWTKIFAFTFNTLFALVLITGWLELWHIYLFAFLRGASMAFDQPARRAMIPSIVPQHMVINAVALITGSNSLMRILGAAGAGILITFGGINTPFIAISVLYAASVFLTLMIKTPEHKRKGFLGINSMGADFAQGLRFGLHNKTIRGIIIISLGYFTFSMSFLQVFAPVFAKEVLNIGDSGFGYMMSIMGAGGIIGAILVASISPKKYRGLLTISILAMLGLLQILFVASIEITVLAFLVIAIIGIGQSSFMPLTHSVLLETAPENMRGRILGLLSLDRSMTTLGGAVAGFLIAGIGPESAQIVFGIACILTALAMLKFSPDLSRIN